MRAALQRLARALQRPRYRVTWGDRGRLPLYQRFHLARINDDIRAFARLNRKG